MTHPNLVVQPDTLPPGTRLAEFEIERVLGIGGFGVVYLAFDRALERHVAVKEYMPFTLAVRRDGAAVSVRSEAHAGTFAMALRSFVNEARLLARFDHPALVKVHRFWEDNGTAYMVMPYYEGQTLRAARASMSGAPDEAWLRAVVEPLLGALEMLHREQVFHRDIAPDNILLLPDGSPVLLDFGAARRVISDQQSLTAILKPSFAPIEQYGESTQMRQGAWTDLYALAAVLYFCITGRPPSTATSRVLNDEMPKLLAVRDALRAANGSPYSEALLATIDAALSVGPQARPQTAAAFRDSLNGEGLSKTATGAIPTEHIATSTVAYAPTQPMELGEALAPGDGAAKTSHHPRNASAPPPPDIDFSDDKPAASTRHPVNSRPGEALIRRWAWALQYLAVAIVALGLGAALASMELFESTAVVRRRLTAADLVLAAGQAGALFILWLAAQRCAAQLRESVGVVAQCHRLVTATALVVVLSCAYGTLLPVLRPFMNGTFLALYKWVFVGTITAATVWLALMLLRDAELLSDLVRQLAAHARRVLTADSLSCTSCRSVNGRLSTFCHRCGTVLGGAARSR
jgi:serine/threonine protein kinase